MLINLEVLKDSIRKSLNRGSCRCNVCEDDKYVVAIEINAIGRNNLLLKDKAANRNFAISLHKSDTYSHDMLEYKTERIFAQAMVFLNMIQEIEV